MKTLESHEEKGRNESEIRGGKKRSLAVAFDIKNSTSNMDLVENGNSFDFSSKYIGNYEKSFQNLLMEIEKELPFSYIPEKNFSFGRNEINDNTLLADYKHLILFEENSRNPFSACFLVSKNNISLLEDAMQGVINLNREGGPLLMENSGKQLSEAFMQAMEALKTCILSAIIFL